MGSECVRVGSYWINLAAIAYAKEVPIDDRKRRLLVKFLAPSASGSHEDTSPLELWLEGSEAETLLETLTIRAEKV